LPATAARARAPPSRLKLEGTAFEGIHHRDIELASDYPTERRAWFDPSRTWATG
jgi:hypothetical protein